MYKIAVLGDYDSIYGFAALGLDTFPVTAQEEAGERLHELAAEGYGIIYITEALAAELKHEIDKISGTDPSRHHPDPGRIREHRRRRAGREEIGGTGGWFRYPVQ